MIKPIKAPKAIITPKKLAIFGSVLGALVALFFIGWQIRILTSPPDLTLTSPGDNSTTKDDYVYVREGQTEKQTCT
jgi:hypothetical protein